MNTIIVAAAAVMIGGFAACGDKQNSADRAAEAQKAIEAGMQKEKAMIEGMIKAGEALEKQMTEQKDEKKQ